MASHWPLWSSHESTQLYAGMGGDVSKASKSIQQGEQHTSDARTEQWGALPHVYIFWKHNTAVIISDSVFRKESVVGEPMHFGSWLRIQTVIVVNLTASTLETTSNNIQKADRVSHLETFPFSRWVDGVDMACALMSQCDGVVPLLLGNVDGHDITETE